MKQPNRRVLRKAAEHKQAQSMLAALGAMFVSAGDFGFPTILRPGPGRGVSRTVPPGRRASRRRPKQIQDATIAAAGEKRMRRRARRNCHGELIGSGS